MAGEGVVVGVNESYREMRGKYRINATVVGDADRELCCFEERQIDLIHTWREVNYKLWQHGVALEERKEYVSKVKGILLRLKNSLGKQDLKERIRKAEKDLNEFIEEMDSGYWRVARFFKSMKAYFSLPTKSLKE